MTILISLIPALLTAVGLVPLILMIHLWKERDRRASRQSPLARNFLRPPGHSLRAKLSKLDEQIIAYLFVILIAPLMLYSIHISQSYFTSQPESLTRVAVTVVMGLIALVIASWRMTKVVNERKITALGLEGELATAEDLNQLMLEGCRVFHDIPFPYGNIDHVVVSHSGIFSVNSKLRGKPRLGDGKAEVSVDLANGLLTFPDRTCNIPIKQFETEANWLTDHLTSAVGCPVAVEPMLALPGWFIKERIGRGKVFVLNPHKSRKFFVHNRETLTPEQVQQVAHQLEQLCRDVEPSFQQKTERWEDLN